MGVLDRRLIHPGDCSWCGHPPHTDVCPVEVCPCAFRKLAGR